MNPFKNPMLPSINANSTKRALKEIFAQYRHEKYVLSEENAFIEKVERSVARLPTIEREIIEKKWMTEESDYVTHTLVKDELMISNTTYHNIRAKALYKISFSLGVNTMSPQDLERIR